MPSGDLLFGPSRLRILPTCKNNKEVAQERLQQHLALELHPLQLLPIYCLHPAPRLLSIWPPTLLMLAAGRASSAISTSLNIQPVPEATWLPCRVTLL
ncbi:hypothetical protein scyTo_0003908 [Scyliorhinus torazame]|uniref:Uncharacterized protein n=1 Tax=Scyliorhinus torazame TaxID=75743 RepID=A0A401NHB3_SCYTO|nr:hypothetical protein [Scyliorhinus torazame]